MTPAAATSPQHHLTTDDRVAKGKSTRARVPRSSYREWEPAADRPDPVQLLAEQATTRVPELVPIRHGRMAASPFAFYRGGALIMAHDLGAQPSTDLRVQLCGDAHLSNFGAFATPDRALVFDLNDFDETTPGPFEWDVKRLCASIDIAGRSRGFDHKTNRSAAMRAAKSYRAAMRAFADMSNLDLWSQRTHLNDLVAMYGSELGGDAISALQRGETKAKSKDRYKALAKLTVQVDGELRFRSDPPLIQPIDELFSDVRADELEALLRSVLDSYARTLPFASRHLLDTYRLRHAARKVVGVGSVGTRAWVALLTGRDDGDPLFLQVKEAERSVLEPFAGRSRFRNHGQRVVAGQSLMQVAPDILLGWERVNPGADGASHDYYVRQLWDWKASARVEQMPPETLSVYADLCGRTLARAHARSGDRIAIASYLGSTDTFDRAMARFASAYADQNDADYARFQEALAAAELPVQAGV